MRSTGRGRAGGGPLRLVAGSMCGGGVVSARSMCRDRGRRITVATAAHPPPVPGASVPHGVGVRLDASRRAMRRPIDVYAAGGPAALPSPEDGVRRSAEGDGDPTTSAQANLDRFNRYVPACRRGTSPERTALPRLDPDARVRRLSRAQSFEISEGVLVTAASQPRPVQRCLRARLSLTTASRAGRAPAAKRSAWA